MIWFGSVDQRYPFLWEGNLQPHGRWHGAGEGPAHYLADTPDGAWAEFVRHEEITDAEELAGVVRSLWAIEVPDDEATNSPELPATVLRGGLRSYRRCQQEARRLRAGGATAIEAPSAALVAGSAHGEIVKGGLREAAERDARVRVLYGEREDIRGWLCADGQPRRRLLPFVRPLR
jgi:hypothetical protein